MKRGKDQRPSVYAIVKERLGSERTSAPRPPLLPQLAPASGDAIDVWEALDQRLDVTLLRPELVNDVEIGIFRLRWGNDYAMIANPRRLIHFQLEVWEAELAQQMDGSRTVGEIIVDRLEGSGDLDAASVTELVILLRNEGFLEPPPMDAKAALAHRLHPHPGLLERLGVFAKTLRVDWTGADRHVRWWYRSILRPLFTPVGAVLTAILAVGGFAAFLVAQSSGRFSIGDANAPLDSLILLILAFVLTYAHELGHALGLVHYDRRIKSAGFMLYFGSPAFFVDASDGLMLERRPRILEAALGPYSEMILAGLGSFLLVAFPSAAAAPLIYKFCVLNYFLIFENLIPLLELDGYFILAEAIEVPDLRERSLQFIQHDLWHKLRGRERLTKQELGLGAYAAIGVLFTIFSIYVAIFFWEEIFGNMVGALWRGGPGSRILLLVLALFLAGPAIRGLITLGRTTARRLRGLWRRLKFRFETSWRVEAAEMIDALPAFNELPEDVLSDLAGRVRLVSLRPENPSSDRVTDPRRSTWCVEERSTSRKRIPTPGTPSFCVPSRVARRSASSDSSSRRRGPPRCDRLTTPSCSKWIRPPSTASSQTRSMSLRSRSPSRRWPSSETCRHSRCSAPRASPSS